MPMIGSVARKWRRSTLFALGAVLVGASVLVVDPSPDAGATPQPQVLTVTASPTPAFGEDAPDPDIVLEAGTYYAFTTGTALGNHIQALVDTSGNPASGYRSYTGEPYGSSALPVTPAWETQNTQTSPGVFYWDEQWLMYYDASTGGYPTGTGHDCLSVATAAQLTASDPVFVDDSSGPLLCQPQLGGSIDPSPFVDPATGDAYLLWKSNDGGSPQPAEIWSAQLDSTGMGFASAPVELMTNDTVDYPWETTVEDPDLIESSATYYLLFSGGQYDSSGYAEGYAVCAGPLGPCYQPQTQPILSSYSSVSGPGGGSLFQDDVGSWWIAYAAWTAGCTSYSCGGSRELYVAPTSLAPTPPPARGLPVQRIYGQDAIGTSIAVSQAQFPTVGSARAVVLARSDYFSDALAGGPLAAAVGGPLLITPGASESSAPDPRVLTEIERVLGTKGTVYVLGGALALSPNIDTILQSLGYDVVRIAGTDEYDTAVKIAGQLGDPPTVFEATGLEFADALSAVPAAILDRAAILLTDGTAQAPETASYLAAHPGDTRYAIGGPLAAAGADPSATAVYGEDLYATSAAVASRFFGSATTFGAATGSNFPDALSGGAFMGSSQHVGPILLVGSSVPLPSSVAAYLSGHTSLSNGYLFGGPLAVGDDVLAAL
jgi:hypothetical protein